jgi:hypothetical protein
MISSASSRASKTSTELLPSRPPLWTTPNALTTSYLVETLALNKMMSVLLDTPRLQAVTLMPRGIPKSDQFRGPRHVGG